MLAIGLALLVTAPVAAPDFAKTSMTADPAAGTS